MNRCGMILVLLAGIAFGQDRNSSVTVDLVFAGRSVPQVTEALALFLEQGGMDNLEVAKPGAPQQTDFRLTAEFVAADRRFTEIRASLTDRAGKAVWTTRATPEDADWKKIGVQEPMQCMMLLIERLRPVLKLDDAFGPAAHQGKFARLMEERSGLPPEQERNAMPPRLATMKRSGPSVTLAVYAPDADGLASRISSAGFVKSARPATAPELHVAANMNEQKMLWDAARGFRDFIRKNPPNADYALYAEYLGTNAVHFIVCDRSGEWVIVDFQNDHHPDFQSIAPKTPEDCARRVVKRLQTYLR